MIARSLFCWLLAVKIFAEPLPDKVPCAVPDRQDFQNPANVHLTGWTGARIAGNEANRLAKIDTDRLLEGYRKRPGRQSWDGEHVGKWLHAATLAWVNTGDPALRAKLDHTVAELMKCQLADGYLGTYLDKDRWTEWDVWAHKYNLLGLLTYIRYTGNPAPLPTCRRMADLLCTTFGDEPGKRDIIKAGHHVGMAPTSVLEPMVLLYRFTGEERYLEFCKYIMRAWEYPNGPHILATLLMTRRVDKVGNAKAYEMLSCLNGALEYYRTVGGDWQILTACLNAWQDIVYKRLYLTGAASYCEHFHDDFDLPNVNNVGETCVTVTWLQFNAQLLRLTGEARFAEQLECVVLNQLFGAQRPDCAAWGYYVQMEGKKPYSANLDGHCCLSSGPRGIALIPTFAISTDTDGIVVNLYDAGTATVSQPDVTLITETKYPHDSRIQIVVNPAAKKSFAIKLRIPAWSYDATVQVNGEPVKPTAGYTVIQRTWTAGDKIELNFPLETRVLLGEHTNAGKVAFMRGPLVLAADEASGVKLATLVAKTDAAVARELHLVPFADAGGTGSRYKVWLPLRGATQNLLALGHESRSREGNVVGSIIDDDFQSFVVTYDGKPASEDWFAVALDAPVTIRRVVFAHGQNFHDGGWFLSKPHVQIQRMKDGAWENIGELSDYPADGNKLNAGQRFTLRLAESIKVAGVRVVGVPASGDNQRQAFSSCAELQAFGE